MSKSHREQFSHLGFWRIFKLTISRWIYFNFRYTHRGYYLLSTAASAFLCAIFLNYHVVDHSEILTNLSRFKSPSRISQTNCKINLRDEGFRIVRNIRDITSSNFLVSYKCPNNEKLSLEIIDNKNNVADRIINYSEESMGEVVLNRKFIKPNGSFSIRARFSTESISEEDLGQADIELYID